MVEPRPVVPPAAAVFPEVGTEDAREAEEATQPVPKEHITVESQEVSQSEEKHMTDQRRVITEIISAMKLTSPEIQRVTSSHRVLSGSGRALRKRGFTDGYRHSTPATRIPQFVSHSWHGSAFKKITTLFVLKNGPPALAFGSFFALVMAILSSLSILPGYDRQPMIGKPDRTYVFAPWGICIGMLIALLVFTFRAPRDRVFLDVFCIHQTDRHLKMEGVLNICAFIKNSDAMLVLWDHTYVERLGHSEHREPCIAL